MAKKKTGKKFRVVKTGKGSYITNKKPKKLSQKQLIKAIGELMTSVDVETMDALLEKQVIARKKFIEKNSKQWAKDRVKMRTDFSRPIKKVRIDLNKEKTNNTIIMVREKIAQIKTNSDLGIKRGILQDIYRMIEDYFSVCQIIF